MLFPTLLAQAATAMPAGALAKSADAVMQAAAATNMTLFQTVVKWSYSFTFIGMAVATIFLLMESSRVAAGHRLSILIGALICFAATISYYYMSTTFIPGHYYVTEFRYADWTITTPLLLLKICSMSGKRRIGNGTMVALVSADLAMIITGYIGEQAINLRGTAAMALGHTGLEGGTAFPLVMFILSCIGWFGVIAILFGPVRAAAQEAEPEERQAVNILIAFPLVLWAIYPLGYLFRLYWSPFGFAGDLTQLLWNLGDFTNKAMYGFVAWAFVQALTERLYGPRGETHNTIGTGGSYGGRDGGRLEDRAVVEPNVGTGVGNPVTGRTSDA